MTWKARVAAAVAAVVGLVGAIALTARAGEPPSGAVPDFLRPAAGTFHVRVVEPSADRKDLADLLGWRTVRAEVAVSSPSRVSLVLLSAPTTLETARPGAPGAVPLRTSLFEAVPGAPVHLEFAWRRDDRDELLRSVLPEEAAAVAIRALDQTAKRAEGERPLLASFVTRLKVGGAGTTLRGTIDSWLPAGPAGAAADVTRETTSGGLGGLVHPVGEGVLLTGVERSSPTASGPPRVASFAWCVTVEPIR